MGFFERLAKSLLTKKQPEIPRSAKNGSSTGADRLRQARPTATVAQPATSHAEPATSRAQPVTSQALSPAKAISNDAVAISVAEPPRPLGSPEVEVNFSTAATSTDLFAGDFDQDLNDAFASLITQDPSVESQATSGQMSADDQVVVEELFADIAANYARPLKNFIFEVKRGTATKEWIEICRPAMQGIRRAASGMGLGRAAQCMGDFEAALSLAQTSEDRLLNAEICDLLLSCYEDLIEVMPNAFVVGEEEEEREGIIINSLLKQIPDLGLVTVEKLYRAGLTSLDTLFLAKKEELAQATGIPGWLTERICEKFQAYRAELERNSRDRAESSYRTRLADMVADLRRNHEGFQRASESEWSNPQLASDKREYRQQRQSRVLQINVLLAEMGELELVNELQKLSFERRIQSLEEFIGTPAVAI